MTTGSCENPIDQEKNPLIAVEEPHIDKLLASLAFTRALDVGTGTGRYAFKLARRGANVMAIDQSAEMLAVARRTAQSEGLSIDFRLASLEEGLLFGSDRFDLLICALTLCHVPHLAAAVQELMCDPSSSPSLSACCVTMCRLLRGHDDGEAFTRFPQE